MMGKKAPKTYTNTEYKAIKGTLMRVSEPGQFDMPDQKGTIDYYLLGIKTNDERRVMVYVSTAILGWFSDFEKSKVWYWNELRHREMKTSLTNPGHYIGKQIEITGYLDVINEKEKKYRMNRVQKIVLYPGS